MILLDVNVLVYAHREDASDHTKYREWLEAQFNAAQPCGISDLVLSGWLRIITHPKIFSVPTPPSEALRVVQQVRNHPNIRTIAPGPAHWRIFAELCNSTEAKGNLVADAYHAALAIESGCEWVTADRGFARFPRLRWRHPLG